MIKNMLNEVLTIKDFPKPGVNFVDISSVTSDPQMMDYIVRQFLDAVSSYLNNKQVFFVGLDSRGFIFASVLSYLTSHPLVLARKAGKLPDKTYTQAYQLEYGEAALEMNQRDIVSGAHYILVDDILATGGTLDAVAKIIRNHGGIVDTALVVYQIEDCKQQASKLDFPVVALAQA